MLTSNTSDDRQTACSLRKPIQVLDKASQHLCYPPKSSTLANASTILKIPYGLQTVSLRVQGQDPQWHCRPLGPTVIVPLKAHICTCIHREHTFEGQRRILSVSPRSIHLLSETESRAGALPSASLPLLAWGCKCRHSWLCTSVLGIRTWDLHEHLPNSASPQDSDPHLLSFRIIQQLRGEQGAETIHVPNM